MSELDPKTVYGYLDVAHRADLAAASKHAWCWGLVAGSLAALVVGFASLLAVAQLKPEWLAKLGRPSAETRAPLATPWSPAALDAVHDEHEQETEQAKQDARDAEGR